MRIAKFRLWAFLWALLIAGIQVGCASSGSSGILEEIKNEDTQSPDSVNSPSFRSLNDTLSGLGYKGVGLQYEDKGTHRFLQEVFADERTHNRNIKLIYTGLNLSYDARYASLTIGGPHDNEKVVLFIANQVPRR